MRFGGETCLLIMKTDLDLDLDALASYILNEATPEQSAIVERWIQGDATRKSWIADLRVSATFTKPPHINVAEVDKEIITRIRERDSTGQDDSVRNPYVPGAVQIAKNASFKKVPRYASLVASFAAIALLFAIGWNTGWLTNSDTWEASSSVYTTDAGQQSRVTLPDGSHIVLNVASKLEVPITFGERDRTVYLSGQAEFVVPAKSDLPFIVVAGPSRTKVLGTRFAVKYYSTDTVANVAVSEGKVSVGSVTLSAMQQVSLDATSIGDIESADASQFSFANGVLAFQDVMLKNVIPDLNRWYNAKIVLGDDEIGDHKVTGGFRMGSITDLEIMLELTFGIQVVRDGNMLTLYKR